MIKNLLRYFISACFCMSVQGNVHAQWCVPNTIIPYAASMPGITHVVVGTIDRTSADLEHYPNNSYVNTGLSTDLVMGSTYTISITHTIDGSICPDMNLRVWVDYNLDYSFDDAGETAVSVNHHAPGTYTGTFTVPLNATAGISRMRITAKMSDIGGHTLPTPCDFPNPDPLGYHGEDEDYTVNLISATGIAGPGNDAASLTVYPSIIADHATISFQPVGRECEVALCNIAGEKVWSTDVKGTADRQEIFLNEETLSRLNSGIYFIRLGNGVKTELKRVAIIRFN
jgi:hypothetical protein